ncbi:4525_t:CDS:2, partial [Entrophospora sp. SA101]
LAINQSTKSNTARVLSKDSNNNKNLRNTASINNNNKETKKNVNIEGVVVNAKNNIDDYKSSESNSTNKTTTTKKDINIIYDDIQLLEVDKLKALQMMFNLNLI